MSNTRVFLVASSLARLIEKGRAGHQVRQGYFPDEPGRSISVQVDEDTGRLILITRGPDGPAEDAASISCSQAEALLDLSAGQVNSLVIPLTIGSQPATLHRYTTPGRIDLIAVAFEQTDQARTYQPPPWFGAEVSEDPAYQGRSMAFAGLPSGREMEITDTGLESLLDILDDGSEAHLAETSTQVVPRPEPASNAEPDEHGDDLEVEDSVIRELARSLRPQRR